MELTESAIAAVVSLAKATRAGHVVETEQGALQLVVRHAPGGFTAELETLPSPIMPETLKLNGLQAAIDYLGENRDGLDLKIITAIVDSPTQVSIVGRLIGKRVRPVYAVAHAPKIDTYDRGTYAQWLPVEAMLIALQAQFVATEGQHVLIEILSNVSAGETRIATDDGVSQEVTVKATARLAAREKLPNPITLQPYRTFFEVDQPASKYIIRLRDDQGVYVALFDGDGGLWRDQAMKAIREKLRLDLPAGVAVL